MDHLFHDEINSFHFFFHNIFSKEKITHLLEPFWFIKISSLLIYIVDDIIKIKESPSIFGRCMELQDLQSNFINIVEALSQCDLRFEGWLIKRKCSSWGESMCCEFCHKSRETRVMTAGPVNSSTSFCHRVKCGIVSAVPVSTFTTLILKLLK